MREILRGETLRHPEVAQLVLVGLPADRPLESNFFPGLLEGLLASLGITPPGEGNLPTSSCEGASRAWSAAVHQALMGLGEERSETPGAVGLPPDLNLHHEDIFLEQQKHLVPPVFSDPLFIPMVTKAVFEVVQPPVLKKALPTAQGLKASPTPPQPEDGGLEPKAPKPEEPTSSTSQPPEEVQEEASDALDIESDEAAESFPEEEESRGSLQVKLPLWKQGLTTTPSSSKDGATPSKVQKETEAKEAETSPPTGPSEAALSQARFELFEKDLPAVQKVRATILELDEGVEVTQQLLDSSPDFRLRRAADESRSPKIIGEHWIDHLDEKGHIAQCKPNDFQCEDTWLPLYTRAGITKHVSGLSSLLKNQRDVPLIAVLPPGRSFQTDREYVIPQLHEAECLSRVSVYYGESMQKQIAFCPYYGVMNENATTAVSHARKHLGIAFLCGGCYTKLYKAPQHLAHHIRTCASCLMNKPEKSQRKGKKK